MEDDKILETMIQYGHHAQELIAEHGRINTILFAESPLGTQILLAPDHDNMDSVYDILKKILHAYDTSAYYLVAETKMINAEDLAVDCLNILYIDKNISRLLIYEFRLVNSEDKMLYIFTAGEEFVNPAQSIDGEFTKYFSLLQYEGSKMSKTEKENIRQMFPSMEPDEFVSFLDKTKEEMN